MTKGLIIMTQKEFERYDIIKQLIEKRINGTQASKIMGLCVRQVRRIKTNVKKYDILGIIHGNRGKGSNRKTSWAKIRKIEKIVKDKYSDFGPTFAAEKLDEDHQIKIGKEKLRQLMIGWNLWKPKSRKKNNEYREWRPRKEYYGEMEQFDGSYHAWFEDRAPSCCLLASIDDACGKPTKLRFVDWEGVKPAFIFWREYILKHGKPVSVYLDRHSTYKKNHKSVFDDPEALTQFQRAMEKDLQIKIIHAYSPQAKGRVENKFGTFQDRLVKELRLHGITTMEEANKFVEGVFIPKFNQKFAVAPQKKGNLHKPLTRFEKENLDKIFSIQDTRTVNNDFTVRYKGSWYQLLEIQPTLILRREKVLIEERINGELHISKKNKYLNYIILPERPKPIKMKVTALSRNKTTWIPPDNHPWKQPSYLARQRLKQTTN